MNALVARLTVGLVVLAAAISCDSSTSSGSSDANPDSETNWLRVCSVDSDCGRGLSCICNTCTRSCDSGGCTSVNPKAECVTPAPSALSAVCPRAPSSPLCTRSCSTDGDCTALGAALSCIGGACLAGATGGSPLDGGAGGRGLGGRGAGGNVASGAGGMGGARVTGGAGAGGAGVTGGAGGTGVTGGAGGESVDAGTQGDGGPFALASLDATCGGGPTGRQLLGFIHLPYEGTYTPPSVRAPEYPWNGPTTPSPLTVGAEFKGGTILCTIDHYVCPGGGVPCRAPIPPTISMKLDVTFKTADGVLDEALTATATYTGNGTSVVVQADLPATQIGGSYPIVAGSPDQVKLVFSGLFEANRYTGGISEVLVGQVSFSGGGWAETAVASDADGSTTMP